ncbi:hypothetical protein JB92DRAFT_794902 [Gautieria morchelliformis]|nr:hypothetical protein JB92DRAFT_794902 [Gautieria morchelliformis]
MTDLLDDSDSIGTTLVCKGRRSSLREALLFACVASAPLSAARLSVLRLSSHTTHSASLCSSPFPQRLLSVLTTRILLDTVCASPAAGAPHALRPASHGARVCDPCRAAREADLCLSFRGPEQDRTGREGPPRAGLLLRGSYASSASCSPAYLRALRISINERRARGYGPHSLAHLRRACTSQALCSLSIPPERARLLPSPLLPRLLCDATDSLT